MKNKIFKNKELIILFIITILGCLIRILGTNWGLPTPLHPDEGTIIDTAIRMAEHHSFEPDVFFRPDHLEIKINMIAYSFISFLFYGLSVGELAQIHRETFILTARIITALFSTGMIFLSYSIGSKIKKEIGLISAFLFAFFPGFIEHSHYATPDIPTGFFMLLCIYFCISYIENPNYKNLALNWYLLYL